LSAVETVWNGRRVCYTPLASRVLVVAIEGGGGYWAAYVDAVNGENHELEWENVARHGTKLSREIAEIMFPEFAREFIWRP